MFHIPRRHDVIYCCAPDLATVHNVFKGMTAVDLPRAKLVPEEERYQLYQWAQMDKNVIPGLIQHQFVWIRKRGMFEQGDLAQYAGDLAFVVDIVPDPDDPQRDQMLLLLTPRIIYKGDDVNAISMVPRISESVDVGIMTDYLPAPPESPKSGTRKDLNAKTTVSDDTPQAFYRDVGILTDSCIVHDVGVQTGDDLGWTRDATVQAYDLSAMDAELSAIYTMTSAPELGNPFPVTRTYCDVGCGDIDSWYIWQRRIQARFPIPNYVAPRRPQRLFYPDLIDQQYPGELQNDGGGYYKFRGQSYLNESLVVTVTGFESIVRAWPTPEEAWMFVEQRLGSALVINMAYLRVGDIVALFESRDLFTHLEHPEMIGTVKDISFLKVTVKVNGLADLVQHRIDRVWRIFRTGTWVEDMMIKKGQIGFVLQHNRDQSLDICYWDDKGDINQYTSYAWYFRTADPPMAATSMVSESGKRDPLPIPKPKLEPFYVEQRRQWRNSFIGKDAYILDGQLKGRIGKVLGIGERSATIAFEAYPEQYRIESTSAVNM